MLSPANEAGSREPRRGRGRGFASMDPERRREISRRGGHASAASRKSRSSNERMSERGA